MKVIVTLDGPDDMVKVLVGSLQLEAASMEFEADPTKTVLVMGEGIVKITTEMVKEHVVSVDQLDPITSI